MPVRFALAVTAAAAVLAGCSAPPPVTQPPPSSAPVVRAEVLPPVAVTIPAIGVASDLIDLGYDADGALEVPPETEPMQAGWFAPGVRPGAVGPAVIAAHVSGRPAGADASVPGLFARLAELAPGDEVLVDRADGTVAVFAVDSVQTYRKAQFPTAAVWGDVAGPQLRLITCGGEYDPGARSYRSNVVAYASLVGVR